jgi:hypothetical protein
VEEPRELALNIPSFDKRKVFSKQTKSGILPDNNNKKTTRKEIKGKGM